MEEYVAQDIGTSVGSIGEGSDLEREVKLFEGKDTTEVRQYGDEQASYAQKAGVICVFYICGLPFMKC
jgi:hypothetical protein